MHSIPHRHTTFVPELALPEDARRCAFEDVIADLYGRGLSVQEIALRIRQLYSHSVSAAAIANITTAIQSFAARWQMRSLSSVYFVLFIERIPFKVEVDGLLSDKVIWAASGIDGYGLLDILGIWEDEGEHSCFWISIFSDLRRRGVTDIPVVSTDGCVVGKPFSDVFGRSPIQITAMQQLRVASETVPGKNNRRLDSVLKCVYTAENKVTAWRALNALLTKNPPFGYALRAWQRHWPSLDPFFCLGPHTRHVLYSSRPTADLSEKISYFTGPSETFPNSTALMKATFLALRGISQKKHAPIRNWSMVLNELADVCGDGAVRS